MNNQAINSIGNFHFYVANEKFLVHNTGATQVAYFISEDYIFGIKIFIGNTVNFISELSIWDRHSTMLIKSMTDLTHKRLEHLNKFLLETFEILFKGQSRLVSFSKTEEFIVKNVDQAMSLEYLQKNLSDLKFYFDNR